MSELKKLRAEFIIVMMGVVIIFLVAIFSVQYISSSNEMRNNSETALRIALEEVLFNRGWDRGDGNVPAPPQDDFSGNISDEAFAPKATDGNAQGRGFGGRMMDWFADNTTRTAVLVVRLEVDGSFTCVRNDMFYMESDYIKEIVDSTDYSKKEKIISLEDLKELKSKVLSDYHMRYEVVERNGVAYIAYVDELDYITTLSSLLKRSILISLAVIIVMLALSMLFSKLALKPVEKAWNDQKRFIADASHELKTPLAVILSNAEMMSKSADKNSEKNARRLDNVKVEADRMKELVQELLEIARGDAADKALIREKVNLSELAEEELMVWDPIFYEAGKSIESEIAEGVSLTGDPAKLKRLLNILIDNALKYSNPGSKVLVKLGRSSLSVSSEGKPLTERECRKIFERFYRTDETREKTSGYGLGLPIAEAIVREHGGTITASSDGKKTNTFTVKL